MKILIIGALPSSIYNFRKDLIKALISNGAKVYTMTGTSTEEERNKIRSLGVKHTDYYINRVNINPLRELITLFSIYFKIKSLCPDIVLAYTIKPIIWTGIISLFFKRRWNLFCLVEGLGYAFQKGGVKRLIISFFAHILYRISVYSATKVIFLNVDNANYFIKKGITNSNKTEIIDGIGVDSEHYDLRPIPAEGFTFLCIARLLGDKGLREYYEAANRVKEKYPSVIFKLIGSLDNSPDAISKKELDSWTDSGLLVHQYIAEDVRLEIELCNVFVLPSYHEGMPRSVMEAMSMGRPILTTNVAGCKETVIDGRNGLLAEARNVDDLVDKMLWLIENKDSISDMGKTSRQIVMSRFEEGLINSKLLKILYSN